jgi:CBS domain-containing protein
LFVFPVARLSSKVTATNRGDTAMLLNSFCMLDVVCCTPRTTVLEAAHLMRREHVGDLVVVEDDEVQKEPLGIITDRDIVVEVLAKGLDAATTLVGSVMRTPVVIAHQDEDSSLTLERMRTHGVRRIPVVGRQGTLVGVVTADDMLRRLAADAGLLTEIVSRQQSLEERRVR